MSQGGRWRRRERASPVPSARVGRLLLGQHLLQFGLAGVDAGHAVGHAELVGVPAQRLDETRPAADGLQGQAAPEPGDDDLAQGRDTTRLSELIASLDAAIRE